MPVLTFQNISKSFFHVPVLHDISFSLQPGRTLGLVGENGAGKSTLMNILGGSLPPDRGTLLIHDQPYRPRNPRDAEKCGIALIHQELNLFPNLTIAENLFLGNFPSLAGSPFISRRKLHRQTRSILDQVEISHSPDTPVEALSSGERQLVEIAKALRADARLIIFDEPTTSLTARETDRLFQLIQRLRLRGISIIYISHNLQHVQQLCDDLAILRDGHLVGHGPTTNFSLNQIVSFMVGRSIEQFFPPRPASTPTGPPALQVSHLSQPGVLHDIHFSLHCGEVLGISGLMGSGRSELARILFGLDPHATGRILLHNQPIHNLSPRRRIQLGLAFLTEDRRLDGLCLEAPIRENLSLTSLPRYARTACRWLRDELIDTDLGRLREKIRLNRSAQLPQPTLTLSGGNQQKIVLGKWLLNQPEVLLLDEPTRGVDVGAKFEIYSLINELAQAGKAVLLISSEIDELIGMCDRILVMNKGALTDEIAKPDFHRERILKASLQGFTA